MSEDKMTLLEEFKDFVKSMSLEKLNDKASTWRFGDYWFDIKPGSNDFNKEILVPGISKKFPEGATKIRVDDDFWAVAVFPYKFKNLSVREIVAVLWPNAKPIFNADVITEELNG